MNWQIIFYQASTKGGYLDGKIELPASPGSYRIVLTTNSVLGPDDELCQMIPEHCHVHPAMLQLLRIDERKKRARTKELVPTTKHWKLQLIVRDIENRRQIFLVNQEASEDDPNYEDLVYEYEEEEDKWVLLLGSTFLRKHIHIVVLIPKNDKRASDKEITVSKVINARVCDEEARKLIHQRYSGPSSFTIKEIKVNVEILDMKKSPEMIISRGLSGVIYDKSSKEKGSIDIKYVSKSSSCERGDREIMVVTVQKTKDVVPVFQLEDASGKRLEDKETYLTQPSSQDDFDDRVIRFKTPEQPHLDYILNNKLLFKLKLKRLDGNVESFSSVPFTYHKHNHDTIVSNGQCVLCSHDLIDGGNSTSTYPSGRTGPGIKRRKMLVTSPASAGARVTAPGDIVESDVQETVNLLVTGDDNVLRVLSTFDDLDENN